MHLDMTVAENIFLGSWPRRNSHIDWKTIRQEATQYTQMVGLDLDPDLTLRQLSASQQQLVSIARALSKDPKILVLDEPTSPLTQKEAQRLFAILHDLKAKGIACILITHKMDEVFQNADRVTVLRDGKSVASYLLSETSERQIIADMVGREITNFYPKETVPIGDEVLRVEDFSVPHPFVPKRKIIDNVSFSVRSGEILGIAGLVGAGRSELVNAIFGKDPKLGGRIYINAQETAIRNPADAMRAGIALVTEDRKKDGIVGGMSIRENLTLPQLRAVAKGGFLRKKQELALSRTYFDSMNIKAPDMETLLQQLSGGNQQKVVLGKWLARKPKVLILDEPTRGIDVGAKYEIYKTMVDMAREGIAIIMISSELPELLSMADRVMVIANEKIRGVLDASDCTQEKIMELSALAESDPAATA